MVKKVVFFTAGATPTVSEQNAINAIVDSIFTLQVRSNTGSALYAERLESVDFVAGTVPTPYAGKPVWPGSGSTGVAPAIVSRPVITGTPKVGTPATSTAGVFSGTPAPNVVTTYLLDGVALANSTPTATGALVRRDVATNASGTVTANSDPVTVIANTVEKFDSTKAYATGTEVIYAGDRYQFKAAHAAGNWTGTDADFKAHVSGVETTWGAYRQLGNQDDWTSGVIASTAITAPTVSQAGKMQVESGFVRARVVALNKEAQAQRGNKFSLSSSESGAINTLSAAYDTIVGGVASSVPYDASTAPYGFRKVLWNGQDSSPIQTPGSITNPSQGHVAVPSYEFSDIVPVVSVPTASGVRPYAVWREAHIVGIGDQNTGAKSGSLIRNYNKVNAGSSFGRLAIMQNIGTSGDMVNDPTLAKSGAMINPAAAGAWPNVLFMFDHNKRTRNVLTAGDSITESNNWNYDSVYTISTPDAPFCLVNFGASGDASAQYLAAARAYIRDPRFAITDLVLPTFSPNESTNQTNASMTTYETMLMAEVDFAVARGIRVLLWTSYAALTPRFTSNGTSVAAVKAYNERMRVRAAAANAPFTLCEIETGWDQATMSTDNTHPNAVGQAYFVSRMVPALQRM